MISGVGSLCVAPDVPREVGHRVRRELLEPVAADPGRAMADGG